MKNGNASTIFGLKPISTDGIKQLLATFVITIFMVGALAPATLSEDSVIGQLWQTYRTYFTPVDARAMAIDSDFPFAFELTSALVNVLAVVAIVSTHFSNMDTAAVTDLANKRTTSNRILIVLFMMTIMLLPMFVELNVSEFQPSYSIINAVKHSRYAFAALMCSSFFMVYAMGVWCLIELSNLLGGRNRAT